MIREPWLETPRYWLFGVLRILFSVILEFKLLLHSVVQTHLCQSTKAQHFQLLLHNSMNGMWNQCLIMDSVTAEEKAKQKRWDTYILMQSQTGNECSISIIPIIRTLIEKGTLCIFQSVCLVSFWMSNNSVLGAICCSHSETCFKTLFGFLQITFWALLPCNFITRLKHSCFIVFSWKEFNFSGNSAAGELTVLQRILFVLSDALSYTLSLWEGFKGSQMGWELYVECRGKNSSK